MDVNHILPASPSFYQPECQQLHRKNSQIYGMQIPQAGAKKEFPGHVQTAHNHVYSGPKVQGSSWMEKGFT